MKILESSGRSEIVSFPRLFKKTNTGAIQYWDIAVQEKEGKGEILTSYGQLGTDKPQFTKDIISEGKNSGKKNATTAYEQAVKEAKSKHEKQSKKGYVLTKEAAFLQEVNEEFVQGGAFPMLAHSYTKQSKKIEFPVFSQPKFDGTRLIATIINGKATLWSRTRKQIMSLPHIIQELENNFEDQTLTLDGEAYNHSFKDNFEDLISLIRTDGPSPNHHLVQYHVYDIINDSPYSDRQSELQSILSTCDYNIITPVETVLLANEEEVVSYFADCTERGYEGCMLRNAKGLYKEGKRSSDLQKVKEFQDAEYAIIGIEEGRGRLHGHVGAFICETESGAEFNVKLKGSIDKLKQYFEDHSLWEGKFLTVQFQDTTNGNLPRFPVGLRIREDV